MYVFLSFYTHRRYLKGKKQKGYVAASSQITVTTSLIKEDTLFFFKSNPIHPNTRYAFKSRQYDEH